MDGFVIPTRQRTDVLFQSFDPLGAGASFTSEIARVAGYGQVSILAVSDQPFSITVTEAAELPPTLAQPQQALVPVPTPPPLPPATPPGPPAPETIGVGTMTQTQATLTSTVVAGKNRIAVRITPFGTFMQMVLTNTGGASALLNFSVLGIPLS